MFLGQFQSNLEVDPYLFPARGRKPRLALRLAGLQSLVDPYLFPARGRKPVVWKVPVIAVFD